MNKSLTLVLILIFVFIDSIGFLFAEIGTTESVSIKKVNELQTQVQQLEQTINSFKANRDDFFKINTLALTTARNTISTLQSIIQWLFMIIVATIGTGLWAFFKKLNSSIDEIKKNAISVLEKEIEELGLDQIKLQKEFDAILKEIEIHNLMFQLNSVEPEQKKAIGSLIEKPIRDNSLIFNSLQQTSLSKDSEIRTQSMLARARCGDKAGLSELKKLTQSKDAATQEAANDALEEYRGFR